MMEALRAVPWGMIGAAYFGFLLYIVMTLSSTADESLASVADVFLHRGKTVLSGILCIPILLLFAHEMGQLNYLSAGLAGYFNISAFKKAADDWMARQAAKEPK